MINKALFTIFISVLPLSYASAALYEDAENGNTAGWRVYDQTPAGATISNVDDADSGNKAIELQGSHRSNGYMLGNIENRDGAWNNTENKQISWSMKYSEGFTVYIRVMTSKGARYLYYTNSDTDKGITANGKYIHYGLGSNTIDGTWHTFARDLDADLKNYESDNQLLAVNGFLIRGSGRVDNIELTSDLVIPDTTAPVISLNGDSNILLTVGQNYVDAGATATDYHDGVIDVVTDGSVDTSKSGFYLLTYTAIDQAGNQSTEQRTIRVISADGSILYEDAENGNTVGWHVYDQTPAGATISNVDDADSGNKAIELQGSHRSNGYMLGNIENRAGAWDDTVNKQIRWSMKYSESFTVYIRVMTSKGARYIYYTNSDTDKGISTNGRYIHYGLGANVIDGTWHTFTRDLEADLKNFESDNELLAVNAFLIRGSGRVDNIQLDTNLAVSDTTAPVITLNGESVIDLTVGQDYVEAGASATDYLDGAVNVQITGSVDTSKSGFYTLTYSAADQVGNQSIKIRTVRVMSADGSLLYEDSEDGNTSGWYVYDKTPQGATISNVDDADRGSKVIDLQGSHRRNGYMLGNIENREGAWNDTVNKQIHWSMKYSEAFTIYIRVMTSKGARYIYYTNSDTDNGMSANGLYIHHGLGASSTNGTWQTFSRDLEADLKEFDANNELLAVNAFLVRGSGRVDDIGLLSNQLPADTTAPVITINGGDISIVEGTDYIDAGASALDDRDGIVMVQTDNQVDTNTAGIYTVTYTATDLAGNTATETRTVTVTVAPDTIAPVISINGPNPDNTEAGQAYTDTHGATASDNIDPDFAATSDISAVNTAVIGSYNVVYTAHDAAGNEAQSVIRVVNVVDTIAPVITLNDAAEVVIQKDAAYVDAGATASDSFEGDLTANITIENPVNTGTPSLYTVSYNVSDGSGNVAATVTRSVRVNAPPVVNAGVNQTVELNQTVHIVGTASDSDGTISTNTWSENGTTISTSPAFDYTPTTVGTHVLTLTATDNLGGTASATITITVEAQNVAPIANAGGNKTVIVNTSVTLVGSASSDTDGQISKFEWSEAGTVLHSSTNHPNFSYTSSVLGEHTITLTVTDNDNATASDTIIVTVVEAQAGSNTCFASSATEADYSDYFVSNETDDKPWPANLNNVALTVNDIADVFNAADRYDSADHKKLVMPTQAVWDGYSDSQKALYLINTERCARGILPFEGISPSIVSSPAQYYADYLSSHNVFSHTADGNTPWERLSSLAGVDTASNADFFSYAENLAFNSMGSTAGFPTVHEPVAKAVYAWLYDDKDDTQGSYGHRKFLLATGLVENSGEANKEGLIGVGVSTVQETDQYNWTKVYTVLNAFDPNENWPLGNIETVDLIESTECMDDYFPETPIGGGTAVHCSFKYILQ